MMQKNRRVQSESKQIGLKKGELHNYDFHKTKTGNLSKDILDHIQNWDQYKEKENSEKKEEQYKIQKFYKDLEQNHSFIQWIFPNFFKSMFNSDCYRLTIEERNLMIENDEIRKFYVNNYKMFLKFLGIEWNNEILKLVNKNQFQTCLRINKHNQLRLRRVLASLSVLGQRNLALQLLEFLQKYDNQLYGTQYYLYDSVKEEQQNDLQNQEKKKYSNQDGQQNQIGNFEQEEIKIKTGIKQPGIQEEKVEHFQQIDHSLVQKQGFNEAQKKNQEEKFNSSNFNNQQFLTQKTPNIIQGKYERAQFLFEFDEVKKYYVQGDLLNQAWVTINLFSKKRIDTQLQ
ncbi:unnamed protein product [Paramecium sonneborni]|uniref:Opioid growth factor receptor (OGFr) conserved domain-containing protein n=1 Tax=Paramecium sonneborni TaxID=65129 RepID=A0A8S1LHY4_9CILI|nr:unnamed protein product [Paramecium sonneborni]